jgi:beta-glucosidase
MRALPQHFLLGCSTSAYQVEGGIENDWAAWERAGRLRVPSETCGRAVEHWTRFEEDFEHLRALGATAYRMSVEWARLEPEPGRFDLDAFAQYRRMLDRLRAHGIEPFVTLLHFTHPPWFHAECPWHAEGGESVQRFTRFAEQVSERLGEGVRFFTVLNEPMVWLAAAHLGGVIPPAVTGLGPLRRAMLALLRAHAAAYRALKRSRGSEVRVGIAHHMASIAADRPWHPLDRLAARVARHGLNRAFLDALTTGRLKYFPDLPLTDRVPEAAGTLDFVGVNYYSRVFVRLEASALWGRSSPLAFYEDRGVLGVSDLGWEIRPAGLTEHLLEVHRRYRLPVYVTENGLDDRDDSRRSAFLYDHLGATLDAVDRGADVRGYLFWSLLDNFEWLEGFGPRFGLLRVDRTTLAREPTRAAALFGEIATHRALPERRPDAQPRRSGARTPLL